MKSDPTHPDYHEGFYSAQEGEPLHYGQSVQYRFGWLGYWRARRVVL